MANIVNFGLSNCYYAKATYSGGVVSYGTPVAIPGSVSLSVNQNGESSDFFADNRAYYRTSSNQGYTGTIEFALLPDSFITDILGETLNTDGVLMETSADTNSPFALLFRVEGDDEEELKVLYYCTASRPPMNANTITETTEPDTVTLDITCAPRPDTGEVSASTTSTTTTAVRSGWTSAVYTG